MKIFNQFILFFIIFISNNSFSIPLTKAEAHHAMILNDHLKVIVQRLQLEPFKSEISRKSAQLMIQELENLGTKDPDSHLLDDARRWKEMISTLDVVRSAQGGPVRGGVEEVMRQKEGVKNDFTQHVAALEGASAWTPFGLHSQWKEKCLLLIGNPLLLDTTFDNKSAAIMVCDSIRKRYGVLVRNMIDQGKSLEDIENIKKQANDTLNSVISSIFDQYDRMLQKKGTLWNDQTQSVDERWAKEVMNFMCYCMQNDIEGFNRQKLEDTINRIISAKYILEGVTSSVSLGIGQFNDALRQCDEAIVAKKSELEKSIVQQQLSFDALLSEVTNYVQEHGVDDEKKQEYEDKAVAIADSMIRSAAHISESHLNETVKKIKDNYGKIVDQLGLSGLGGWTITHGTEADRLKKEFNGRVDKIVLEVRGVSIVQAAPQEQPQEQPKEQVPQPVISQKPEQEIKENEVRDEFVALMKTFKDEPRKLTPDALKQYENNVVALARKWISVVDPQEKNNVVEFIKQQYKDAVENDEQKVTKGLLGWFNTPADTTPLQKRFNDRIDQIISGTEEKQEEIAGIIMQQELEKLSAKDFQKKFLSHLKALKDSKSWDQDKKTVTDQWKQQFIQFYKTNPGIQFGQLSLKGTFNYYFDGYKGDKKITSDELWKELTNQ